MEYVCSMMEVRNQDVLTGQLQPRLNYQLQHQQQHTQVPYLYDHSHHHVQTSANYQQSITRSTTTGEGDLNLQTTYQTRWYPARSADCDHSDPAEYTTDLTDRNQQPTRYTSNYHYEQNVSFYTNPASDYHSCNTTNIYYHRANDKDWQQTAPNSDPYCQTSYGPSYYDYHHQQQQQTAPSTSFQNQQENIQFSYNHAKYYPTEPYHAQTFPQPPCQLVEQQKPANPDQGQSRTCLEAGSRYLADEQQATAKPQEQSCWTRLTGSSDDLDSRCSNAPNTSLANASVVRSDNQQAWPTQNDSLSIKQESEQRHNHSTLQPQSLRQKRQRISKNYTTDAPARTNYCRVCGRNYARPSTLKTHLRTHTNERPFKCDVCLKTFSQAANLTAHQRVHTGERPFSCPICDRQFSQSSSVITHLRTHSGERPYRCNMCSRTFSDSSTLTKHCRIHSGEKPYQCDHCPLNFSQSGNLSRHLRLHQINSGANSVGSSASSSSSSSSAGPSSSRPHLSNDLSKTQTVKYDE